MEQQSIQIQRKGRTDEQTHKVFSIRVKSQIVEKLDMIALQTNRSRNELINLVLEYGVAHIEVI